jgi:uncharacterized membrane protein
MFVVTSLPHAHDGNKVYKFTFFDKFVLCECSDGQKKVSHWNQSPLPLMLEKTESVTSELIILPMILPGISSSWYRFPIGTFDKILENVYNFKGGLDLLN